jgi:di/tricarboxylate transporter
MKSMNNKQLVIKLTYLLAVTIISVLIAFLRPLQGYPALTNYALAIYFWVVANWMYQIIAPYIVGFIGLLVALLLGIPYTTVFSGFSNNIFWVIVGSYFIAIAFIKSNIARRLGYYLVSIGSGSLLSILNAVTWANTIFSPVIMSNTARGGVLPQSRRG